jgi:hypothetical protein
MVMPKRRYPQMFVTLTCPLCGDAIVSLDLNTETLSSVLMRIRREHTAEKHPGWKDQ